MLSNMMNGVFSWQSALAMRFLTVHVRLPWLNVLVKDIDREMIPKLEEKHCY